MTEVVPPENKKNIEIDEADVVAESELKESSKRKELDELLSQVADVLIDKSLQIVTGDKLLILLHPSGWRLANMVTDRAREKGADVHIRFYFPEMAKILLEAMSNPENYELPLKAQEQELSEEEMPVAAIHHGIGADQLDDVIWGNKYLLIRNKMSSGNKYDIDPSLQKEYDLVEAAIVRFRNDDPNKRWTLIYEPNEQEAELAGLTLEEYRRVYYEALDMPWDEVEKAQQFLIDYLATKKLFRVTSSPPEGYPDDWNTDITMSIEGMRGANSTIKNNLPGSEVFLAPATGSLNGTYAIPYPVMLKDQMFPNIKFVFKDGKVESYDVYYENNDDPQKQDDLARIETIISIDDGAKVVGELGIGTNPKVKEAYLNSLLVEKAGGSIHLALGNSYPNKGEAKVNNGNKSALHTDVTRMLTPKYGGGSIEVDGELIQKDGRFLFPELAVLNPPDEVEADDEIETLRSQEISDNIKRSFRGD